LLIDIKRFCENRSRSANKNKKGEALPVWQQSALGKSGKSAYFHPKTQSTTLYFSKGDRTFFSLFRFFLNSMIILSCESNS